MVDIKERDELWRKTLAMLKAVKVNQEKFLEMKELVNQMTRDLGVNKTRGGLIPRATHMSSSTFWPSSSPPSNTCVKKQRIWKSWRKTYKQYIKRWTQIRGYVNR